MGSLHELCIVGVVLSPEYVFATKSGDPLPDDKQFGILWMGHKAMAAAFDLDGAFNDVVEEALSQAPRRAANEWFAPQRSPAAWRGSRPFAPAPGKGP